MTKEKEKSRKEKTIVLKKEKKPKRKSVLNNDEICRCKHHMIMHAMSHGACYHRECNCMRFVNIKDLCQEKNKHLI